MKDKWPTDKWVSEIPVTNAKNRGDLPKYKGGGKIPAWQRKEGKNPEGGKNEKEGGSRRDSFCARMKGMRKRQKPSNNTGKDRLSLSLKKWNC